MTSELLETFLFDGRHNAYACVDGASIPGLRIKLFEMNPRYYCLFRGELEDDVAENAPYLVGLIPGDSFTEWLLSGKTGKHSGIFAKSRQSLIEMRRHFRELIMVQDEAGKPMIFRYYDPRVISQFLPTCNEEELGKFFGPVDFYVAETENGDNFMVFSNEEGSISAKLLDSRGD